MICHVDISDVNLRAVIKAKHILLGGNRNLRIYGKLSCRSGKRMKRANRVFFSTEKEAIINDFRPCGHCLGEEYQKWENGIICFKN